ncbi:hypothetical protein AB1A65_05655 [Muricauda sp. ANG21]|uniref:hypothetical protein n=1 Tax=Allomuricauda sp. ANG21 TaxID=3042468 RepID=UPI003455DF7D
MANSMIHAQEVRVIDNKGNMAIARNTTVNSGTTAPSSPILNDIWFDTSDSDHQRVKVWDGSSWVEIAFTGTTGSVFFAGSDGLPTQDNTQLFWDSTNNRLGIGTALPSQSLDVTGRARIRTLDEAGTTDQILKVDANGVLHTSKINYGGRWTNTDTSTNLNVTSTVVPIFGSNDYVDDGTNLYEVSGNTLIVKESGRYDVRLNMTVVGIDDSSLTLTEFDTNVNARIAVNGTPLGSFAATGLISFNHNNNHSSLHLSDVLELNANDIISIVSYREANSGTVLFYSSGSSSFSINKLR